MFEKFIGNGSKIALNLYTPKVFHVFAPGKSMVGRWILSFRDGHPFREKTSSKLDLLGQYKGYIEGNPRSAKRFCEWKKWVHYGEWKKTSYQQDFWCMANGCFMIIHDDSWYFIIIHDNLWYFMILPKFHRLLHWKNSSEMFRVSLQVYIGLHSKQNIPVHWTFAWKDRYIRSNCSFPLKKVREIFPASRGDVPLTPNPGRKK